MTQTPPTPLRRQGPGRYVTDQAAGTQLLGRLLGGKLEEGDLLVLSGDLGAGKTNLVKGVAAALGVTEPVTSPTFTIQSVHQGAGLTLYHFDLYRLDDPAQLGDAGVLDVAGVEGASLIEWGEAFADYLGEERLDVAVCRDQSCPPGQEPPRVFSLVPHGRRAQTLLADLDAAVVEVLGTQASACAAAGASPEFPDPQAL